MQQVTYSAWFADASRIDTLITGTTLETAISAAQEASMPDVDTWVVNDLTGEIIDAPVIDDREHCDRCDEPSSDLASVGADDESRWCYACRHWQDDADAYMQCAYYGYSDLSVLR